jgi:very-short-patch-repair endonuclease
VYAVGHPALTPRARMMAALLAAGRGAILSHRSAGVVWDLQAAATTIVDVSVPRGRRGRAGMRMHRPRRLDAIDSTVEDGFPVTTASRTLFDLAGSLPRPRFETLWEAADRRNLLDFDRLGSLCAELGQGRKGAGLVRRLLAETTPREPVRSELERRFADLCRDHGLPLPSQNVYLHGFEVDAYWPAQRLVVELDGFEFHGTRRAFSRDRHRDAVLAAAGLHVLRLGWHEVVDEPSLGVAAVSRWLRRR